MSKKQKRPIYYLIKIFEIPVLIKVQIHINVPLNATATIILSKKPYLKAFEPGQTWKPVSLNFPEIIEKSYNYKQIVARTFLEFL